MRNFNPGRAMTIFVVFFLPVLLFLGSWQIVRGLDKQEIWSLNNLNKSLPVMTEKEALSMNFDKAVYRSVFLDGRFGEESYLLDNRLYKQEAGYEVFSVFESLNNNIYLVNRGWVSKKEFNGQEILMNSRISVEGVYSPFRRFGLNLSDKSQLTGWPKKVQELNYEQAALDLGMEIKEVVIQLSAGSPGAYEPIWLPAELKPSRHYGYAAQWFGLALVLAGSYIYFGYRKDK
jgi:cytochrome oxidase assembly protein ShyY1